MLLHGLQLVGQVAVLKPGDGAPQPFQQLRGVELKVFLFYFNLLMGKEGGGGGERIKQLRNTESDGERGSDRR